MGDNEDDHALSDFLRERLPQVGLDYETYGPYVLPLLTEEEADEEEWNSVLELLQASSESHGDDMATWQTLRSDIQTAWNEHRLLVQKHEQEQKEHRQQELQQALAEEKRQAALAAEEAAAATEQKKQSSTTEAVIQDAQKRALVERFGYDVSDEEDEGGETEVVVVTNQQAAAQAQSEKMKELRSQKGQTKKEEQIKTSLAKMDKARLKEERRKKTTKIERKRG